jgi:hypothetical protein
VPKDLKDVKAFKKVVMTHKSVQKGIEKGM